MSPGKKITKKQMKEDKLVSTVFKTSEYIQKNPKPFYIGGSVVAIVFIAVVLYMWNIDKKNNEAAAYLARAQISYDSGLTNDAVIDLKTVVDNYSSTEAAAAACFNLSNIYFDNKNYQEALPYFIRMIEDFPGDKMKVAAAAAGAAACHEQMGNRQEAGRYYQIAAELYPDDMWAPGYLLSAGRNYEAAGDLESAKRVYNVIIENYDRSRELNTAKRSLAEIES
jgi:tetratricopeptide (TPR) repeat protein